MPFFSKTPPLQGLYPCPLGPTAPAGVVASACKQFGFLGRLIGKALLDDFRLPIPLHPAFWDVRQAARQGKAGFLLL